MKKLFLQSLCVLMLIGCGVAYAQDASQSQSQADNTKANAADRDSSAPTADQQRGNASDLKLTQQIRRAITKDNSLSTYAHNVKIIVQNGTVTLKGPVRSDDEKQAVEAKAAQIAGADKVKDELEVAQK
jgi:hyperosmotically inducible periplasmic protein